MTTPSKPILHNGFKVRDSLTVKGRIERIFFTDVYELSDGKYLYLFTNMRPEEVVDRGKKYDVLTINHGGKKYLGVIINLHSHEKITDIIDSLTTLRGFDCVAGMQELKALLISDVIEPLRNPEKFLKFKLGIPNGILLYGPPGCGKTFIVTKLAEELGYNLIKLSPSSVATPYVHGAVGNIGKVFEMARLQAPSIVFIDEIEGLIPKREGTNPWDSTKREEINEFLLQTNNAGENNILVVGATNLPNLIDIATLRAGRMDKRIFVGPPDFEARKDMFRIFLSGRPYDKNINFDELAKKTEFYVGADIELIVTQAARLAVAKDKSFIDEQMLLGSTGKVPPSISKKEISHYDQFTNLERS